MQGHPLGPHCGSVEAATTQSNLTEGAATKARVGVINALSHVKLPPRNIHSQKGGEGALRRITGLTIQPLASIIILYYNFYN